VESTPRDDDRAFDLNGVPATSVEPNSPGDEERANPAYVEFVLNGIQVQISGGSDLKALLSIASTMILSRSADGAVIPGGVRPLIELFDPSQDLLPGGHLVSISEAAGLSIGDVEMTLLGLVPFDDLIQLASTLRPA
jgi:hypothetical protein